MVFTLESLALLPGRSSRTAVAGAVPGRLVAVREAERGALDGAADPVGAARDVGSFVVCVPSAVAGREDGYLKGDNGGDLMGD